MFRDIIKLLIIVIIAIILSISVFLLYRKVTSSSHLAQKNIANQTNSTQERFQEGKHYQKLPARVTTNALVQQLVSEHPGKIQVIGFFSYSCFWCQRLHPVLNDWSAKQSSQITFTRLPVVFAKGWDVVAKAYYIVEALKQNQTLDTVFFNAIHKDHLDLTNEQKLQEFFQKQGILQSQFSSLFHSFEINQAYTRGNQIANAFEVTVSPAVVITLPSGSYLVTPIMAGNEFALIEVLEFLISRESIPKAG